MSVLEIGEIGGIEYRGEELQAGIEKFAPGATT